MKFTGKAHINLHQLLAPLKESDWDSSAKDLYYLQGEDGLNIGPVKGSKLSNFLKDTPLPTYVKIKPIAESAEWIELYEHPLFQRRKPTIVKDHGDLIAKDFYVVESGVKSGPFNFHEITEKLERGDILLNQQISYDGGETWFKLFELPNFDRRQKSFQSLPSHPTHESLADSRVKRLKKVVDDSKKDSKEMLASLAISKENKAKAREKRRINHNVAAPQVHHKPEFSVVHAQEEKKVEVNNTKYAAIMSFSIIGILYLLFTSDSRESYRKLAGLKEKKSKIQKIKDAGNKAKDKAQAASEKINFKEKVANRRKAKRKTASSKRRSGQSQNRQMKRAPVEKFIEYQKANNAPKDDYAGDNYDQLVQEEEQEEANVEQDPVKSQVSAETLGDDYASEADPEEYSEDEAPQEDTYNEQ